MTLLLPELASPTRRVLLFSLHNLLPAAWNGVIYELMDVVQRVERATLAAPAASGPDTRTIWSSCRKTTRAVSGKVLTRLARPTAAQAPATEVEGDFDLTFYACQFPHEIREINCIPHWRERTRKACIFILETWAHEVERHRAHFGQLDAFDHVFVFNARSVPLVQRYTRAPVSYLATAADTLLLPETSYARERCVDYLCIGRRHDPVHARMFELCCRDDRFYVFDLWRGLKVKEWPAARRQNADMGARARHYIVWTPTRAGNGTVETTLTTRYFEGASSGAVMIGSAPALPEFAGLFSSPEPVVEMPEDPEKLADFLDRLEADAAYLAAVGRANRLDALARHDWAHRWAEVLEVLGLASAPGLDARLAELGRRHAAEALAWRPQPAVAACASPAVAAAGPGAPPASLPAAGRRPVAAERLTALRGENPRAMSHRRG